MLPLKQLTSFIDALHPFQPSEIPINKKSMFLWLHSTLSLSDRFDEVIDFNEK
jgi:hypothetical protein